MSASFFIVSSFPSYHSKQILIVKGSKLVDSISSLLVAIFSISNDPSGIETHWYHDYSKNLAEIIHKHLIKQIPSSKDRGLFKSKFYVINHTTVPAVLCEIGFLSNPDERNELITENRKQRTAKAIADGIIEYLRGKK